jgi:hypothetical protein
MKTLQVMRNAQDLARSSNLTLTVYLEEGEVRIKTASNESHANLGIDFELGGAQSLMGFVFPSGRFEGAYY